ncbi:MAG TPA: MBL fold metallo-hydrolase, partial [Isosphaeraceae bacterium]|nr:MBL fold metallo-hydrolase [Isosphaeraceae bacterium]
IPGHSPGSVVLWTDQAEPPVALVGDVLFAGSVGRTDFPGGSAKSLFEGIRSKLFCLPDNTEIYPGHGPVSTIGREKQSNPFVGENAGIHRLD